MAHTVQRPAVLAWGFSAEAARLKAGVFEALVCDVERLLRNLTDRMPLPCAVLLDYQNAPIDPGKRGALATMNARRRSGAKAPRG